MNAIHWRRLFGAFVVAFAVLTAPAGGADTTFDRIFKLSQLAPAFEHCANSCQVTLDQQIQSCTGYNPQRSGANATPKCRQASYQVFEACMATCARRFPSRM
jgi:hypothetical protein